MVADNNAITDMVDRIASRMGIDIPNEKLSDFQDVVTRALLDIDDPYTSKTIGSKFYVEGVDDILLLHEYCMDGGSMAVDTKNDKFIIVE